MKKIINELVKKIKSDLMHDMSCNEDDTLLILAAYNRYQEDERDGTDYIFDINNWDDIKCCIDGGMTVKEFNDLFNQYMKGSVSPYFMFGHNRDHAEMFKTIDDVKSYLAWHLDDVITCMLCYHNVDEYKQLYEHCISDFMLINNMV